MNKYNIDDIIKFNGIKLIVTNNSNGDCKGCYFDENRKCAIDDSMGECLKFFRKDGKDVIFKQIK